MPQVDLSIVIVNYDTGMYLKECLKTIPKETTRFKIEVIVVDNHSSDGSIAMISREFPRVRLISNPYNYGFSVATNQGYRLSHGRYVMTLNPDTEVLPETIETMLDFMDQNPRAGIVAPAICASGCSAEPEGIVLPWHEFSPLDTPRIIRRLLSPFALRGSGLNHVGLLETQYLWGTGYVCRRNALPAGHMFTEANFLFGEEYDLCHYVRQHGYGLYIYPNARIRHVTSVTFKRCKLSLMVARKLGCAVLWSLRQQCYGKWLANLNQISCLFDYAILWTMLTMRDLLDPKGDDGRELMRAEYQACIAASICVLLRGNSYLRESNTLAQLFFNRKRADLSTVSDDLDRGGSDSSCLVPMVRP